MQIVIYGHDLIRGVGRPGLLTVPKRCVRDPDLSGHVMGNNPVVKRDLGYLRIGEHIPEYIGLLHIIQNVHMLLYLQQVVVVVHGDGAVLEHLVISHIHPFFRRIQCSYYCIQLYSLCQCFSAKKWRDCLPAHCNTPKSGYNNRNPIKKERRPLTCADATI